MIEMGQMSMGDCIRWYRRLKKLSREDLAREVNVTTQTLRNWERNDTVPSLYDAYDMAQELGVTIEQLMGEVQPEPYIDDRYLKCEDIAKELSISAGSVWNFYKMSGEKIRTEKEKGRTRKHITLYHCGDMVTYINRWTVQR